MALGLSLAWPLSAAAATMAPMSGRQPPPRPPEFGPSLPEGTGKTTAPAAPIPSRSGDTATPPGQASCLATLAAIPGNRVTAAGPAPQDGDPACRISEPVRVEALAVSGQAASEVVSFEPPPLLSCTMAKALADWLDRSVQPLARGHFDRDLVALRVGGGHECRRRNRGSAGPVSEHATGQALDIFAFRLGTGSDAMKVAVEKPQGLAQSRFLDAIRQSACGAFMTTLGPGSDAAHADHLHVDIRERRARGSRLCQ